MRTRVRLPSPPAFARRAASAKAATPESPQERRRAHVRIHKTARLRLGRPAVYEHTTNFSNAPAFARRAASAKAATPESPKERRRAHVRIHKTARLRLGMPAVYEHTKTSRMLQPSLAAQRERRLPRRSLRRSVGGLTRSNPQNGETTAWHASQSQATHDSMFQSNLASQLGHVTNLD